MKIQLKFLIHFLSLFQYTDEIYETQYAKSPCRQGFEDADYIS